MRVATKIVRGITSFFMSISAVFIFIATILATINALFRFFSGGLPWAEELCSYFVVLMVYLAIPYLEYRGDQLSITAIDGLVKSSIGQKILQYIRGIFTAGSMALLGYYGIEVTTKAFARMQKTYTLQIPKGYLYAIAAGCLLLTAVIWLFIMFCRKGEFDNDY